MISVSFSVILREWGGRIRSRLLIEREVPGFAQDGTFNYVDH